MKEIFVRIDRCVGCRSCELACAVEHSRSKNLLEAISEIPRPRRRLYVEQIKDRKVPFLCRHCEDAPCVRACRTSALSQDPITNIVTHNPDRCIGCWLCAMVCPYGVINREEERRIAIKCDRCPERAEPACVQACPTKALVFAEEQEFAKLVRREAISQILHG
ncbi:MAG: 4Fe-4S dicluster domain-containing protein [Thermodesulforhabdaceae bacterium]